MNELKPCPFCGSTKLKIDSKQKRIGRNGLGCPVDQVTFSVRCNVCHARGGAKGGKVLRTQFYIYRENREAPLPEWAKTEEQLRAEAIEAWNRRVSE